MRVKRGTTKNAKHKKILKQAKGYRMSYSKLYRRAREAVLHAGSYSAAHRRRRRSQKTTEWVKVISASLSGTGMSYSKFMNGLKTNNVIIDRKNLAEMAVNNPEHFQMVLEAVK